MLFITVAPGLSIVFRGTQHVDALDLGVVLDLGTRIPQQLDCRDVKSKNCEGPVARALL